MTDRAFEPPNPDPFAQPGGGDDNPFAKIASGAEPAPAPPGPAPARKPANDDENPFTKLAGGAPVPDTSATGAFARGAARGALPAIGSIPAIGAGAEAGAAFGAPFGPIGMGIGGFAGGVAGGFGGAALIAKAQDYLLSKLPESWTDALGMSERQEKLDQTYHGTASFLGGLAPYAVTMRPGIATSKALPENATALQRIMAHPATAHVFSGAVVGGMELGQEAVSGNPVDWSHVAIATGFGVVFNQPTKIGQRLTEAGAQPARRVLGKPEPVAAASPPHVAQAAPPTTPESAPTTPTAAGVVRFYHGGEEPTSGGPRWATPHQEYARNFRAGETPNTVHYVDIPKGDPTEIAARNWDEEDERNGINNVGTYKHIEIPEKWAKQLKPLVAPPPSVTAADFRNEITERTRTGRPYELAPTVADAADLKVMGPGVTEDVFLGSHEQDPAALQTAREAKRTEQSVIGEPPQPDIHAVARRMHPETFERYDELRSRRAEFARWIEDRNNPSDAAVTEAEEKRDALQKQLDEHVAERKGYASGPEARKLRAQVREAQRDIDALQERRTAYTEGKAEQTPELIAARQHLLATDVELRDLHGEVQAAYRRAADAIGSETVPPEVKAKPPEPVAEAPRAAEATPAPSVEPPAATPTAEQAEAPPAATAEAPQAPPLAPAATPVAGPPKPRTIEQQRDFIRQDVAQQLIKAGRPKEEAEAAGALMAARYETRAARFNGKLGNAEELYLAESAEILGPKQRSTQQTQPAAPRKVNEEKLSLLQFLAHRGGLKETGDLKSILDGNPTVKGFGKLLREDGMTEDRAREAASEAGYLVHNQETTGEKASIRDLHEAIHEESRGRKRYRFGHEPEAKIDTDESEAQREAAGSEELPEGVEPHEMEPDELAHLSEEDRAAMELLQTTRGSLLPRTAEEFERGLRPIMRLAAEQNASTFIHESGHQFLEELMRDAAHEAAPDQLKADSDTVKKWLGINKHDDLNTGWPGARGKRARAAHERFATGFEQYLREGTAPSKELASVFAKFRQWLTSIYETLKGLGKPINEDIRNVFDRMLSAEPQRTVIAPEVEVAKSLADHHDLDAAEAHPAEADALRDRVDAERYRAYDEHPHEQAELDAAITAKAAFEAEGREAGEGTEPPGEVRPGGGGLSEVQPGGDAAGAEPQGGGTGPADGPQRAGVDEAGAESPGLRGAGPESRNRENLESVPLAPSPAAGFPRADAFNVGKDGNIRVENITSVPAFMRAIEESSERISGGGPITMGEMIDLADSMAIDPKNITETKLASMFGGIQNLSSKIWALRTAIRDSAEIVHAAMRKVRDDGSDAAVAEFALAMSRHDMMQSVLSSVTTETGRGTGMSFRNMEGWQKAEDLNELIKANTGRTLFQLKQMAKLGAQLDSPAKVSKFLRDAQNRSFGGMILEYWINGLISGPATHVTYMLGNQVLALQKAVPETLIASAIGAGRAAMGRGGERVRAGEALTGLKSMVQALPAATQAALEALRTGQPTLLPGQQGRPLTPFMGDTMLHVARSLTNDPVTWGEVGAGLYSSLRGLRDGLKAGSALLAAGGEPGAPLLGLHYSPLGQIPDIAVRGVPVLPVGSAIRLPGRSVSAIHSFFATSNYIREVAAEAYRTASHENLTGDAFATRIADIRTNPSEDTMQRAITGAYASTLMSEGGAFVKALSQLTNAKATLPLIGEIAPLKFIDPFVHIGANVINQAIVQRSPLGLLSAEIRADLAGHNGNVAQDMAAARMLAGTALSLVFGSLAMEGYITGSGPKDPAKAAMWREVYQPHSVRIGDMWYQVNRLGPMGMLLGVAADLYDVAHDASEGEMLTAAAHLQHAVTQNILDESFMRGPADLIKAIEDPGRYGESYLKQFASSFLPFSVGMAQIARASDPYSRQARNVTDALLNKIPGQSEKLFPRINIWGEPTPNPDAMAHAGLTAVYLKKVNSDPVNKAMLDLGIYPAMVKRTIRNVELTDAEYDDFARIAGRTTKMRLDAIVRSADYQRWPTHLRHDVVEQVIHQSREAAMGMMMMKFPHIPRDASEALRKRKTGE